MDTQSGITLGAVVLVVVAGIRLSGPAVRAFVDWLEPIVDARDGLGLKVGTVTRRKGFDQADDRLRVEAVLRRARADQLRRAADEIRRRASRIESGGAGSFVGDAADRVRRIG